MDSTRFIVEILCEKRSSFPCHQSVHINRQVVSSHFVQRVVYLTSMVFESGPWVLKSPINKLFGIAVGSLTFSLHAILHKLL